MCGVVDGSLRAGKASSTEQQATPDAPERSESRHARVRIKHASYFSSGLRWPMYHLFASASISLHWCQRSSHGVVCRLGIETLTWTGVGCYALVKRRAESQLCIP